MLHRFIEGFKYDSKRLLALLFITTSFSVINDSTCNSGGPLYYKDVIIQNSLIKVVTNILGVASGYRIFKSSIASFSIKIIHCLLTLLLY